MIELGRAKQLVMEWLQDWEATNGPAQILSEQIEEHEWGWVIYFGPVDPMQLPEDQREMVELPFVVDRVTGHVRTVSTSGVTIAVAKLLKDRPSSSETGPSENGHPPE